jgi:hypothetical protein
MIAETASRNRQAHRASVVHSLLARGVRQSSGSAFGDRPLPRMTECLPRPAAPHCMTPLNARRAESRRLRPSCAGPPQPAPWLGPLWSGHSTCWPSWSVLRQEICRTLCARSRDRHRRRAERDRCLGSVAPPSDLYDPDCGSARGWFRGKEGVGPLPRKRRSLPFSRNLSRVA